jgi:hypothetical protein
MAVNVNERGWGGARWSEAGVAGDDSPEKQKRADGPERKDHGNKSKGEKVEKFQRIKERTDGLSGEGGGKEGWLGSLAGWPTACCCEDCVN